MVETPKGEGRDWNNRDPSHSLLMTSLAMSFPENTEDAASSFVVSG